MNTVVIGGGAAGFFAAINSAINHPGGNVTILEKSNKILSKVKISGGGRCNVTHACFDPKLLVKNYPRGNKELLSAFYRFQPQDTINWFAERGVPIVAENDGRMFPESNSSQTIIDCFTDEAKKYNIEIRYDSRIEKFEPTETGWNVTLGDNETVYADTLIVASGNNERVWEMLADLGYEIVPPVPSLFTFNCTDVRVNSLPGISVPSGIVSIPGTSLKEQGPVLITHWGFSGPAILKLSAWGARILADLGYEFKLHVNWTGKHSPEQIEELLKNERVENGSKKIVSNSMFHLSQRLWDSLVHFCGISEEQKWNNISREQLKKLAKELSQGEYTISGKSTFKDEFVTSGGVALDQINFKTMESKLHKNLFFAGEVLDIDGITGGFNFQAAWSTAFIAAG